MGGIMRATELTDDTRLARTGRFGEDGGAEDATQACRHETVKLALKIRNRRPKFERRRTKFGT